MSERNSKLRIRSARTENDGALKTRHLSLDVRALDREKRTLPISFSSETREVQTWDYELGGAVPEILSHAEGACDLSPLINAGSVLRNHDPNQIVGVPLEAKIDAETKRSTAMIRFGTTDCAEQTFREVSDGILRGVSVGYEVLASERIKAGARSSQGHEGPCMVATKWRVHELTLTPIPADSSVGVGRSKGTPTNTNPKESDMDKALIFAMVRAAGLDTKFAEALCERNLPNADAVASAIQEEVKTRSKKPAKRKKAAVAARMDTEEERAEDEMEEDDDEEEVVEEEARSAGVLFERKRSTEIRAAVRAARLDDEVADDLINKGTSISSARAIIIEKMSKQDIPAIGSRGFETVRGGDGMEKRFRFLSANLARSAARGCGLDDADAFNDGDLKKVENGYVSLQGSVREMLVLNGVAGARDMQPLALWENFLRRSVQIRAGGAANSSGDLANLLSNLQNKSLSRGYAMAAPTWRSWCRKGTLNDFKISPWVQMSDAAALKETGENGEILDSKLSDRGENRQLAIYARSVSLTWEMFQNDDISGLGRLSFMLGKSAAQLPSRLVYASLLSNPIMSDALALFHASHGNLRTGASSNLDDANKVTALKNAVQSFRDQTAPKAPNDTEFPSEPVDISPRVLIVPPAHEYASYQLVNPNLFVAETQFFKNKFVVEVEPRLSNTGYSGSSLTAWYLAAAAEDADTMEVSFLNGNEAPQTMNWEDFDRLALRQRVVLPCGVKPLDWRTIVKSNGA